MPKSSVQRTLRGLSIALFLEALVLYTASVAALWTLFSGGENSLITVGALAVITLGCAIWLTFVARAIPQGMRWARSAAIFWQLMQLTIAFGTYDVSVFGALAIALPTGAVLITLFTKDVVQATGSSKS